MSIERQWYFVPVNPQPWTTPPFYPARAGGKMIVKAGRNESNEVFKQAVKEELLRQGATMLTGKWNRVTLGFWRRREQYKDSIGRTRTKNWADATNMQKLTEDALQGILFENDRDNFEITSRIVQQDITTTPGVLILCESFEEIPGWSLPPEFLDLEHEIMNAQLSNSLREYEAAEEADSGNAWPPRQ